MVLGQLFELTAAQPVRPGITDIRDEQQISSVGGGNHREGGHRRAHPGQGIVGVAAFDHQPVGSFDGGHNRACPQRLDRLHGRTNGIDGDLGRRVAAAVAAHSVGDCVEAIGEGQHAVLVDRPDPAHVGRRSVSEPHQRSTCNTVWPTWSRSPGCMGTGPWTFFRFRKVPLVEPRSSTKTAPSR